MIRSEISKAKVYEQICSLYPDVRDNIKEVTVFNISEDILLWKMKFTKQNIVYFYTNKENKILFNGMFFSYASPFSKGCSLVKIMEKPYLLDLNKKEIVEVPIQEMNYKTAYHIRNGNIAIHGKNNHWGSFYYEPLENVFREEIPFIWDVLEFSKNGEKVAIGLCGYKTKLGDIIEGKWTPDEIEMKIKLLETEKEKAKDFLLYRKYIQYMYKMRQKCSEIKIKSDVRYDQYFTEARKQKFLSSNHDLYGYDSERPIFNQCTNKNSIIVDSGDLEEYRRIRGYVIK